MDVSRAAVQEAIRVIKTDGSLPEGRGGEVLEFIISKVSTEQSPLTHLHAEHERLFKSPRMLSPRSLLAARRRLRPSSTVARSLMRFCSVGKRR